MSDGIGSDPRRASGSGDLKRASKAGATPATDSARGRPASANVTKSSSKNAGDVGKALRSVYDATLGERVPDDFLDLLGKLS